MKRVVITKLIITLTFLLHTIQLFSQDVIIKNGDSWSYFDKGYLNSNWVENIDHKLWPKGNTPIGYGDSQNNTTIYYGDNPDKKHIVKYFKKTIFIEKDYIAYEFRTQIDDGGVIYVNGTEILRTNMPKSTINNKTLAINTISSDEELEFRINVLERNIFKKGENTISVSVHQAYEYSSDCIFSLELIGHTSHKILSVVVENKNKDNKELENKIEQLNSKFEIEKVILQKEALSNTNYILKTSLVILSFLFILAIAGYYFVLEYIKRKNTLNNSKLIEINKENLKKEKENLTLTSNLLHNKQYFKEIKADIKSLKTEDKLGVKNILTQIDFVLDRDEDWESLKIHFDAVYDGFYDNLLKEHPSLSETELRHCMFIKLHLQTKEISRILLIDPRSVQTARYRIKKKMELNEETDLRNYLLTF
jgi:DNA-binding CsgD family transcriptional regulator